jgi:hypothetical protein
MAEKFPRFISGRVTRCRLAEPGGKYNQYSCHVEGFFEDTRDPFEGWLNSNYPVSVYEGQADPIDPKETENLTFDGRLFVLQSENRNGDPIYFLNAVSIENRIGYEEPSEPNLPEGNPFLDNPLVG